MRLEGIGLKTASISRGRSYVIVLNRTIGAPLRKGESKMSYSLFVERLPSLVAEWIADQYEIFFNPLRKEDIKKIQSSITVDCNMLILKDCAAERLLQILCIRPPLNGDLTDDVKDYILARREAGEKTNSSKQSNKLRLIHITSLQSGFAVEVKDPYRGIRRFGAWSPRARI